MEGLIKTWNITVLVPLNQAFPPYPHPVMLSWFSIPDSLLQGSGGHWLRTWVSGTETWWDSLLNPVLVFGHLFVMCEQTFQCAQLQDAH